MDSAGETQMTPTHVSDEEANLFAIQLACASPLPMVLKTAIELNLLEIIAGAGPGALLSPLEIADQLPTTNPDAAVMLDRMLRLLATFSILTYSLRTLPDGRVERLYGLAPVCKFLTKNEGGVSIAPLCLMNQDKVFMEIQFHGVNETIKSRSYLRYESCDKCRYHLKDAVLEGGIPFNRAYGMTAFDYPGTDPRFNKVFNRGMSDHSTVTMEKMLETYKGFEGVGSVVDVGGGTGAVLNMIISKYPSIKGINFDLPHVIKDAPEYRDAGIEHVGGDMFVSVPKGDAIFMKWICHDWSDQHCLKLLTNCYEALPRNGKVIVAEFILPVAPDSGLATKAVVLSDVLMLAYNPGGKERTQEEFRALAEGAGFQGFRVKCCAFNTYVMEFLKSV